MEGHVDKRPRNAARGCRVGKRLAEIPAGLNLNISYSSLKTRGVDGLARHTPD
jgi:hypothetical protein